MRKLFSDKDGAKFLINLYFVGIIEKLKMNFALFCLLLTSILFDSSLLIIFLLMPSLTVHVPNLGHSKFQ
jgi:hypothetical protein